MNQLILAKLSNEQIAKAKSENGERKKITHVLLCGDYGQRFGTEKQCLKYYNAWKVIFKELFESSSKSDSIDTIPNYETTFDLVNILMKEHDKLPTSSKSRLEKLTKEAGIDLDDADDGNKKKPSIWKRLFR